MRRVLIALLAVLGLAADSAYVLAVDQQPGGVQPSIDINVTEAAGGQWLVDPMWIGVGIVALILLIVIVALATRGGGTTIIKE